MNSTDNTLNENKVILVHPDFPDIEVTLADGDTCLPKAWVDCGNVGWVRKDEATFTHRKSSGDFINLGGHLDHGAASAYRSKYPELSIFVTLNGVNVEGLAEEAFCGVDGWVIVIDEPPKWNEAKDDIIRHKKFGIVKAWMAQ